MAKNILLTGAGFTHNFGGPLAAGMWTYIFNHPKVQKQAHVRKLMLQDFDYESIYHKILKTESLEGFFGEEDTSADDKEAVRTAVFEAYKHLDDKILNLPRSCPDINKVSELIERFASERGEKSFFFTLNQDLFIERHFSPSANCKPFSYPGINRMIPIRASVLERHATLKKANFIQLPSEKAIEEAKSSFATSKGFHYIKLHGSYGWTSSDGSDMLVIGQDKVRRINNEPLLSWYSEIFKDSLKQDDVKLLTIGYGFRDEHINKIIADSVKSNRLKLFVLSTEKPDEFFDKMSKNDNEGRIVSSLCGYFQYDLLQIFPGNQSITADYKKMVNSLFS